jgi:hypothetical protein
MKKLLYYPGLDPVDFDQVRTFIAQKDDLVFFFHGGGHQHWHFNNKQQRDQAHAYIIFNFTDRPKDLLIKDLRLLTRQIKKVVVLQNEILIEIETAKSQKLAAYNGAADTLLIYELINAGVKVDFSNGLNKIPYPINPYPLNITV